jgi:rhodanese-related sulfurtransferase
MAHAKQHNPRFLKVVEEARARVREVTIGEIAAAIAAASSASPPFTLIDVREDHEWTAGHLPRAVHLGRGILERDVETRWPDPATPLVLYCGGGYRSALAVDSLMRMGYTQVRSLAGGFRGWTEQGLSLETTP